VTTEDDHLLREFIALREDAAARGLNYAASVYGLTVIRLWQRVVRRRLGDVMDALR
jgi:hypothetical protein